MQLALPVQIPSIVIERVRALWQHYDLSLGIRGIDAQHVWLVALVLELEWVLLHEEETVAERFQEIIREAREYAHRHFVAEEALFREFHFAEDENHRRTHKNFSDTMERIIENVNLNAREEADKLQQFLRKWLVQHIRGEDGKYADFFRRRKLMEQANSFFDSMEEEAAQVSPEKYELLALVEKKNDVIEVTTPAVLKEIASIWNRLNLRIGIPLIDIQHLWLIKMIVDMDEAMRESPMTREAVLSQTIAEAVDYIDVHFRTEEALMDLIGYDDKERHKRMHHYFESFVQKRQKEFAEGQQRSAITIVNDLKEWLTSHIALEDRELTAFYKAHKEEALAFSKERITSGAAGLRQNQLQLYRNVVQGGGDAESGG